MTASRRRALTACGVAPALLIGPGCCGKTGVRVADFCRRETDAEDGVVIAPEVSGVAPTDAALTNRRRLQGETLPLY
jgi:hypothetical protein